MQCSGINVFIDFHSRGPHTTKLLAESTPSDQRHQCPIPGMTHPEKSFPAEMDTQSRWWWWWSWWGWGWWCWRWGGRWWTLDTRFRKKGIVSAWRQFIGIGFDKLARECYRLTQAFHRMVSVSTLPGVFAISLPPRATTQGWCGILSAAPFFIRLKFKRMSDETTR